MIINAVVIFLVIVVFYLEYRNYRLSQKVDQLRKDSDNHNTLLLKLIYHKSIELEQYELAGAIENQFKKYGFDLNKL